MMPSRKILNFSWFFRYLRCLFRFVRNNPPESPGKSNETVANRTSAAARPSGDIAGCPFPCAFPALFKTVRESTPPQIRAHAVRPYGAKPSGGVGAHCMRPSPTANKPSADKKRPRTVTARGLSLFFYDGSDRRQAIPPIL
jgi:hypothetical protein